MRKTVSLLLKMGIFLSAAVGVSMIAFTGGNAFMDGKTSFMYFTTQSNILLAIVALTGMVLLLGKRRAPRLWHVIKFAATISITLTGTVYCFLLMPVSGYGMDFKSALVHAVVPVLSVVDFFVMCPDLKLKWRDALYALLPPIAYVLYAGYGYAQSWEFSYGVHYPYFFLDWGSPAGAFGFTAQAPFMGCMWWILLLMALLIIVGLLYILIYRGILRFSRARRVG